MIRSILIPLGDDVNSFVALSGALFLGQEDGGGVEIRGIFPWDRQMQTERLFREKKLSGKNPDDKKRVEELADKMEKEAFETVRQRFQTLTGDYPGVRRLEPVRGTLPGAVLSRERASDIVILGRPDTGGGRGQLAVNNDILQLLWECHRPVMLISRGTLPGKSILLACGDGPKTSAALRVTGDLARMTGGKVYALFVGKEEDVMVPRIKTVEDYLRPHGVRPVTLWKKGKVAGAIRESLESTGASILVMGSPRRESIFSIFAQDPARKMAVRISKPVVFCK